MRRRLCVLNYYVRTCPYALNYYILKHLCNLIFHVPIYISHAFVPLCLQLFCVYVRSFFTYLCVYNHAEHRSWHISSWCQVWWKLIFQYISCCRSRFASRNQIKKRKTAHRLRQFFNWPSKYCLCACTNKERFRYAASWRSSLFWGFEWN